MTYLLSIAGIRIRCEIPYELKISDCTEPFLGSEDEKPDLLFRFHGVDALGELPPGAIWQEEHWFLSDGNESSVYHCQLGRENRYAKVFRKMDTPGVVECAYVLGQEQRISCTRDLVNLLGLEDFLLRFDRLLLHASFISWEGKGILFSAPSGTGKSTQAELWRKTENAQVINGDRAAIGQLGGQWTGWGLPYAGTSDIYRNESAPISAIVVLRQGKENSLRKLRPPEAVRMLYPELSIHRWDPAFTDRALNLLIGLVSDVPVYVLQCLPDDSAVELLKNSIERVQ